jgi:hypothetical protein
MIIVMLSEVMLNVIMAECRGVTKACLELPIRLHKNFLLCRHTHSS